jgi:hypothetical protein
LKLRRCEEKVWDDIISGVSHPCDEPASHRFTIKNARFTLDARTSPCCAKCAGRLAMSLVEGDWELTITPENWWLQKIAADTDAWCAEHPEAVARR